MIDLFQQDILMLQQIKKDSQPHAIGRTIYATDRAKNTTDMTIYATDRSVYATEWSIYTTERPVY